jgi:hypothetical protein
VLGLQSIERTRVTGKVLIMGWLGSLYPYLPDRSRLARGVISGETARSSSMFFFSPHYKAGCQVLVRESYDECLGVSDIALPPTIAQAAEAG